MKPKMGFNQKPKTTPFCIEIKHKTGQCDRKFETKNGRQKTVPKIHQVLVFSFCQNLADNTCRNQGRPTR
jgi:hypothetical protein